MYNQHSDSSGLQSIASVCRVLPTPEDPAFGVFVLNRLKALARLVDVQIFQPVPYLPVLKPLPAWIADETHSIERVPMPYVPGVLKSLDARWLLRAVLPRLRPLAARGCLDAIDAHFGYPDGVAMVEAGRRLGVPVFVTLRGVENEQFDDPWIGPQLRRALHGAQGCICVSQFLAERATSHGVSPDRVTVIPNAIDRDRYHPGSKSAARLALGVGASRRLIVSVANLIPRKRHHVLIEAVARSIEQYPELMLVILGSEQHDPGYASRIRALIAERGLSDRVLLRGVVPPEQVPMWLQAGDAFALLSSREGCCNALLEALATGLPAVATRVGDNANVVENEANGYLVDVDDADGAAQAIGRVLARQWNAASVSAALKVGDWAHTAGEVKAFMEQQLGSVDVDARSQNRTTKEALQ